MYCFEIKKTVISMMACLHTWFHLFVYLLPEVAGRMLESVREARGSHKYVPRLVTKRSP
jgi:hypothetical protein